MEGFWQYSLLLYVLFYLIVNKIHTQLYNVSCLLILGKSNLNMIKRILNSNLEH